MWLLTDEEIYNSYTDLDPIDYLYDTPVYDEMDVQRAIAKAQLMRVADILKERHIFTQHDSDGFVMGSELWQQLLKEIG